MVRAVQSRWIYERYRFGVLVRTRDWSRSVSGRALKPKWVNHEIAEFRIHTPVFTSKEKQGLTPWSVDRKRATASYSGRYQRSDILLPDKGIQSYRGEMIPNGRQKAQIPLTAIREADQNRAFLGLGKGIFSDVPLAPLEEANAGPW